jgi:hypothetical protein
METCKFCGRELKNKHALKAHEFRCKFNPNYEENEKSYTETMKNFKMVQDKNQVLILITQVIVRNAVRSSHRELHNQL